MGTAEGLRPAGLVGATGVAVGSAVLAAGWVRRRSRRPRWAPAAGIGLDLAVHVRTLGSGPAVVLLHGLLGSGRFWGSDYDVLAAGHRLLTPDLVGFGSSPRPQTASYSTSEHATALADTLDELGVAEPAVVVAHSLGVLVALALAREHPGRVRVIVGFGPPLFADASTAQLRLRRIGGLASMLAFDTPLARRVCEWMCAHRRTAALLARLMRPDLPAPVADDAVQHTWVSYSRTVANTLLAGQGPNLLNGVACPITLVAGRSDPVVDNAHLRLLAERPTVRLVHVEGGHDLPLHAPRTCLRLIEVAMYDGA